MASPIPPIGTRGVYSLNSPWTTTPGVVYTCAAIRRFVDLANLGTDVYETYYAPSGLTQSDYEQDRRNDEVIVTLISETTAPIYVPSSYIAAFPDQSFRNYHHVVLSASLGPLPDYIDLTFVREQVATAVSEVVGQEATVHLSVAPMRGTVSPEEHEVLEAARQAAITNRTTDYARFLEVSQENTQLHQRLAIAETLLKENGLIPE